MALPSSGQISMNQVNVELGLSGTTQISLNQSTVRTLFAKSSGQISMSDGWGKSNKTRIANATGGDISYDGDYQIHTFTSAGTFTVTQKSRSNIAFGWCLADGGNGGENGQPSPGNTAEDGGGAGGGGGGCNFAEVDTDTLNLFNLNVGYTVAVGAGGASNTGGGQSYINTNAGTLSPIYNYGGGGGGQGGHIIQGDEQFFYPATDGQTGGAIGFHLFGTQMFIIYLGGGGGGGGYQSEWAGGNGGSSGGGGSGGSGGSNYNIGNNGSNSSSTGSGGGGGGGNGQGQTGSAGSGGQGTAGIVIIKFLYQE